MATLISEGDNYGTHRRCDATCHNAKKPKCACICRGRYHGKSSDSPALREAVKQTEAEFRVVYPEIDRVIKAYEAQAELPLEVL